MCGYIYKTTCLVNNVIYVGQKKSSKYLGMKYLGSGKILKSAIIKYGRENFKTELLEECYSFEELNKKEKSWIKKLNSTVKGIGYNITDGGQCTPGFDCGYHLGMKDKHQSEHQKETVRKTSSYKRSKEICENMSKGQKGKIIPSRRIKVRCIELDRIFDSLALACEFAKSSHVGDVCVGLRHKAGGYTWEFVNKDKK